MKIAMVGMGFDGKDIIEWSEGIFTEYDNTDEGGDFSVVLAPNDYMCSLVYDFVIFIFNTEDSEACLDVFKDASTLQLHGRKFAMFAYVGVGDDAPINALAVKVFDPMARCIVSDLEEGAWCLSEEIRFVPWAKEINVFLAAKKRLHELISEEKAA